MKRIIHTTYYIIQTKLLLKLFVKTYFCKLSSYTTDRNKFPLFRLLTLYVSQKVLHEDFDKDFKWCSRDIKSIEKLVYLPGKYVNF